MSDVEDLLLDDESSTAEPKWAKLSVSVRPRTMTRLDEIVQRYPFRSRSEAVEMALESLFEKVEKERCGNGTNAKPQP